ncbi:MIP/aquaporin family protein [Ruania halotolerans]|uniref:MIP/aquaporin family protein n=1 Tax=Ruania halotolerans TaxID=2897773 RepID=UPI001E29683E|nr:aquaporin [Ruania halotolerans]UFU05630.1 aquaporin [Ruania halotolerans]
MSTPTATDHHVGTLAPQGHPDSLEQVRLADRPLFIRFAAEILGTFILVFIGFGVALYAGVAVNPDEGAKLLAWAAGVLVATALIGHVSGAHLNPAVTLGAAITGRISWADILPYWVAQLIGGVGAAALLFVTIPAELPTAVGQASTRSLFAPLASGIGENSALGRISDGALSTDLITVLLIEAVATALFVAVALAAGRGLRRSSLAGPVVIGLAYGGLTLAAYPLTGGALNPVRATAAAIFAESWALGQLWVFWVAPLLGGAIAGLLFTVFAPEPLAEDAEDYAWDDEDDTDDDADEDFTDETDVLDQDIESDDSVLILTDDETDTPERDDAFTEDYDVTALDPESSTGTQQRPDESSGTSADEDAERDEDATTDEGDEGETPRR